jgi:hypothetical protein
MSARSGPKLAGIGRSGASDIVMCMDAHDARSYGGEAPLRPIPANFGPLLALIC